MPLVPIPVLKKYRIVSGKKERFEQELDEAINDGWYVQGNLTSNTIDFNIEYSILLFKSFELNS